MRRVAPLYIIADVFNVWVKSQRASHLLLYIHSAAVCCLVEVHEEKPAPHRYLVGKGRSILIASLENYVSSS